MARQVLAWCHQVCGLYLDQSDNTALKQRYLTNHTLGMTFGGTALSNPMKAFAGIESMILRGKKSRWWLCHQRYFAMD